MNPIDNGLEPYIKKRIQDNDKAWGITVLLVCIVAIGFYLQKPTNTTDYRFQLQMVEDCNQFKDSLLNYCKKEYEVLK